MPVPEPKVDVREVDRGKRVLSMKGLGGLDGTGTLVGSLSQP